MWGRNVNFFVQDDTQVPDGVHVLKSSVSDEIWCYDGELFEGHPKRLAFDCI